MAAINFPNPAESPWTNPDSGVTYIYVNGIWKAHGPEDFDTTINDDLIVDGNGEYSGKPHCWRRFKCCICRRVCEW